MINAKTVLGLTLLIISGVEFLTIKDHYHVNKINTFLLMVEGMFCITIAMAVFLMIKGLRKTGTAGK